MALCSCSLWFGFATLASAIVISKSSISIVPNVNHVQVRTADVQDSGHVLCEIDLSEKVSNDSAIEFAWIFRNDYNLFRLNSHTLEVCNTERLHNGTYSFEIAIKINGMTDMIYGSMTIEVIGASNSSGACSDGRCSHVCTENNAAEQGYICSCWDGYVLQQDGHTCSDIEMDICGYISPCKDGTTCINTGFKAYSCLCANGYRGKNCSISNMENEISYMKYVTFTIVSSGMVGFLVGAVFFLPIILLVLVVMKRKQRPHAERRRKLKQTSHRHHCILPHLNSRALCITHHMHPNREEQLTLTNGRASASHVAVNVNNTLPVVDTQSMRLQSAEDTETTYYVNEGLGPADDSMQYVNEGLGPATGTRQQGSVESVYDDLRSCSTSSSPSVATPMLNDGELLV